MKGTVQMINARTGMVAAQTEDGDYTVFELMGDEVELHDEVQGDLHSHGGEAFVNLTRGERIEVYVQAIYATRQSAVNLVRGSS